MSSKKTKVTVKTTRIIPTSLPLSSALVYDFSQLNGLVPNDDILAIDPDIDNTGLAASRMRLDEDCEVIRGKLTSIMPLWTSSIPTKPTKRLKEYRGYVLEEEEVITYILTLLKKVLITLVPRLVVVEDFAYGARSASYTLGQLGGCIRQLLREYSTVTGAEIRLTAPSSIKKFVTGNGASSKDMVVLAVGQKIEHLNVMSNDETDAVGLLLAHTLYDVELMPKITDLRQFDTPKVAYDMEALSQYVNTYKSRNLL